MTNRILREIAYHRHLVMSGEQSPYAGMGPLTLEDTVADAIGALVGWSDWMEEARLCDAVNEARLESDSAGGNQ